MRITLTARVGLGSYWDLGDIVKEIEIKTEHTDDPGLPWDQICGGLVQAAIAESLEKRRWEVVQAEQGAEEAADV